MNFFVRLHLILKAYDKGYVSFHYILSLHSNFISKYIILINRLSFVFPDCDS